MIVDDPTQRRAARGARRSRRHRRRAALARRCSHEWRELELHVTPRLRADRDLRPAHGVRVATRSGTRSPADEQARAARAPGRRHHRRRARARGRRARCTTCPPTARRSARSCMRGNNVMKGYYRDPEATREAFHGGWFHSGDLGVVHPDGYIELRDRKKDIIISGGENISTIEVEQALAAHPAVLEVRGRRRARREVGRGARRPSSRCRPGAEADGARRSSSSPRAPRPLQGARSAIEFGELPKTSTGQDPEVRAARAGAPRCRCGCGRRRAASRRRSGRRLRR